MTSPTWQPPGVVGRPRMASGHSTWARNRSPRGAPLVGLRAPSVPPSVRTERSMWRRGTDKDDTRWRVQAAVPSGAIVAWKVGHRDSVPTLQPGWVARDIPAPLAPAVVNGVIFAVSRGARPASPAVLFALDGATGREIWNSGTTIPPVVRAALSAGGSQVYVATGDGTLYAFGFPMEH